jgi:hypothetical protein
MKSRKDTAKHILSTKKRAKNDIFRKKYLSTCFYVIFKPNNAYFLKIESDQITTALAKNNWQKA